MPTTPVRLARRTHAERSQQTRQHLIATTIQIVQDRGLEAASIHEVAKTAGMTPGAVQHHFASKADLMMQVLAQIVADQDASGRFGPRRSYLYRSGLMLLYMACGY
ncbi:MAG: TetR family transcriptional regulator [Betaproteobacteria bacterium]|nr:TetR family transcriptional regulator [Betaproteobacteria bacterium]